MSVRSIQTDAINTSKYVDHDDASRTVEFTVIGGALEYHLDVPESMFADILSKALLEPIPEIDIVELN